MAYHESWYPYNAQTVQEHVPPTSGVYALFAHQSCVYVGASRDLQAELTRLLKDDGNPCRRQHRLDEFQFEVVIGDERNTRRAKMIRELKPACRD